MKSKITRDFRILYGKLSPDTRKRARKAYALWHENPQAQGLYFKRVSEKMPIYSVHVGQDHRALGILRGDTIFWYWIGKHDEYIRQL